MYCGYELKAQHQTKEAGLSSFEYLAFERNLYPLSITGVDYATLDRGYNSLLRSGRLKSTIGVQGMIQKLGGYL